MYYTYLPIFIPLLSYLLFFTLSEFQIMDKRSKNIYVCCASKNGVEVVYLNEKS